jgi:apolipoprotein D and lipocalin family protein
MMSSTWTRFTINGVILLSVLLLLAAPGRVQGDEAEGLPPVTAVAAVDLGRYAGLWYEVARIPNRFQKQCVGRTTAEYTLREDGRLDVINSCRKNDGSVDQAEGLAKIEDPATNAKLKVSFFSLLGWRPAWGDYWVVGLDPDYRWAAIGTPDRKYGWILARTPGLTEETLEEIFSIFQRNGYHRDAFEMSPP